MQNVYKKMFQENIVITVKIKYLKAIKITVINKHEREVFVTNFTKSIMNLFLLFQRNIQV